MCAAPLHDSLHSGEYFTLLQFPMASSCPLHCISSSTSPSRVRTTASYSYLSARHLILPVLATATRSSARPPLQASRRFPNYSQEAVVVVPGARPWIGVEEHDHADVRDDDGDDDDEEDDDRSLDLLARFLHNVFRKVSRRARKAVRSVMPPSIPTRLVSFSVNGVLILAFLWILKAFLEVICTFGSMVFVSILLVRGIWSGVSYIKESNYYYANRMDDDNNAWNGVQAAT